MNNEPVAWIDPKELDMTVSTSVTKNKQFDGDIPLYTHPVKEPTEYMKYRLAVKEFGEGFCITYRSELLAYADAILRKAQGK